MLSKIDTHILFCSYLLSLLLLLQPLVPCVNCCVGLDGSFVLPWTHNCYRGCISMFHVLFQYFWSCAQYQKSWQNILACICVWRSHSRNTPSKPVNSISFAYIHRTFPHSPLRGGGKWFVKQFRVCTFDSICYAYKGNMHTDFPVVLLLFACSVEIHIERKLFRAIAHVHVAQTLTGAQYRVSTSTSSELYN